MIHSPFAPLSRVVGSRNVLELERVGIRWSVPTMSGPASTSGTGTGADLPPSIASTALRKLVALELTSAGFDSADEEALEELEGVVYACA